jgi:hypothetical protein
VTDPAAQARELREVVAAQAAEIRALRALLDGQAFGDDDDALLDGYPVEVVFEPAPGSAGTWYLRATTPGGSAAFTGSFVELWATVLGLARPVAAVVDRAVADEELRASGSTATLREGVAAPAPDAHATPAATSPAAGVASTGPGGASKAERSGEGRPSAPPDQPAPDPRVWDYEFPNDQPEGRQP